MATEMVDPARRLGGDVHAAARHHGRQRGAALDPRGPRRQLHRPAVGGRRVRADARCARADRRLARRPARPAAAVRDRARDLLVRFAALRARARPDLPQPRPRRAGHRRRGDVRRLAGAASRRSSPPAASAATAMGIYGATIGVAVAIGPLVGGALTDALGWRVDLLPERADRPGGDRDHLRSSCARAATRTRPASTGPGVATFSTALFLLVLALVRGNDEGWGSTLIVSLFAGSAVLLAAFMAIESRVSEPMLPLALFRRPAFTGVQLAAFAISASVVRAVPLHRRSTCRTTSGYTPFEAGLRYLPITLAAFFIVAGRGRAPVPGSGPGPDERRPGALRASVCC